MCQHQEVWKAEGDKLEAGDCARCRGDVACRWRMELPRKTAWRELCQETNGFFDAGHSLIANGDEPIAVPGIGGGYNLFVVDAPPQRPLDLDRFESTDRFTALRLVETPPQESHHILHRCMDALIGQHFIIPDAPPPPILVTVPAIFKWGEEGCELGETEECTLSDHYYRDGIECMLSLPYDWLDKTKNACKFTNRQTGESLLRRKTDCDALYTSAHLSDGSRYGRRHARRVKGGGVTLQGVKGELRAACVADLGAVDCDMAAAHQSFIAGLCGDSVPLLNQYLDGRDSMLGAVMRAYGCSRSDAKDAFTSSMFDAPDWTIQRWKVNKKRGRRIEGVHEGVDAFLVAYNAEVMRARSAILTQLPFYHRVADETAVDAWDHKNRDGRAFAYLLQSVEDVLLERLRLHMDAEGAVDRVVCLIHDGLLVTLADGGAGDSGDDSDADEVSPDRQEQLGCLEASLKQFSQDVGDELGWWRFKVVVKEMKEVPVPRDDSDAGRANALLERTWAAHFDERWMTCNLGTKVCVAELTMRDYGVGGEVGSAPRVLNFWPVREWKLKVVACRVRAWTPGSKRGSSKEFSRTWLESRAHNTVDAVVFNPNLPHGKFSANKHGHRVYNTWMGLAVVPVQGDCEPIRNHILKVLCAGCGDKYRWLTQHMAHLVRHPGQKTSLVPVVSGGQGCGKGFIANDIMGSYFGQAFLMVNSIQRITGKFNSQLGEKVFIVSEETQFGGDHKGRSTMKSLVGDSRVVVERKGIDPTFAVSFADFWINSNDKECAPLEVDDRRYGVLLCAPLQVVLDETGKSSVVYWEDMIRHADRGGRAAFLHYLLADVDMAGYNHRGAPPACLSRDRILLKLQTLRGVAAFLYTTLGASPPDGGAGEEGFAAPPPSTSLWRCMRVMDHMRGPPRVLLDTGVLLAALRADIDNYNKHEVKSLTAFVSRLTEMLVGGVAVQTRYTAGRATDVKRGANAYLAVMMEELPSNAANASGDAKAEILDRAMRALREAFSHHLDTPVEVVFAEEEDDTSIDAIEDEDGGTDGPVVAGCSDDDDDDDGDATEGEDDRVWRGMLTGDQVLAVCHDVGRTGVNDVGEGVAWLDVAVWVCTAVLENALPAMGETQLCEKAALFDVDTSGMDVSELRRELGAAVLRARHEFAPRLEAALRECGVELGTGAGRKRSHAGDGARAAPRRSRA